MSTGARIASTLFCFSVVFVPVLGASDGSKGVLRVASSKTTSVEVIPASTVDIPLDSGAFSAMRVQIDQSDASLVFHAIAPDGHEMVGAGAAAETVRRRRVRRRVTVGWRHRTRERDE